MFRSAISGQIAYVDHVACHYDSEKNAYVICWSDEKGNYYKNFIGDIMNLAGASAPEKAEAFALAHVNTDIEGIIPGNVISVSQEVACRLVCKLTVPNNVKIEVPERVSITSEEDLKAVRATAI